jgi:hypothetical protein
MTIGMKTNVVKVAKATSMEWNPMTLQEYEH